MSVDTVGGRRYAVYEREKWRLRSGRTVTVYRYTGLAHSALLIAKRERERLGRIRWDAAQTDAVIRDIIEEPDVVRGDR